MELEAIALTSSLIEEASQFPFDEISWDSTKLSKDLNDFTLPVSLGPDPAESTYATFDDFDDFDGYLRIDTTLQSVYTLSCAVDYVYEFDLDSLAPVPTHYKRLNITTTNHYNLDSLFLNYVHGYWYFN